jgi:hypothetical protein
MSEKVVDKSSWSEADFLMDAGASKSFAHGDLSELDDADLMAQRKQLGHIIERLFLYGCPQPNDDEELGRGELMAHYIINEGFQKVSRDS